MRSRAAVWLITAFLVFNNSKTIAQPKPHPPKPTPTPQEVLLLFPDDAEERTILTLNNNRTAALTTSITLFKKDGVAVSLSDIALIPNESKQIELSTVLKTAGIEASSIGWLKLEYSGFVGEMGAQLTLYPKGVQAGIDSTRSLSIDFKSNKRSAVFWMPKHGHASVSLTNTSSNTIAVTYSCGYKSGAMVIPGLQSRAIRLDAEQRDADDQGAAIPCDIDSDGPVTALRVSGESIAMSGFSAPIRFYDPITATFQNLTAVALSTSAETHVTLHNLTSSSVPFAAILREATLQDPYQVNGPSQTLAPGEAVQLDLTQELAAQRSAGVSIVTLTIQTSAPKGALVGAVTQIHKVGDLIEDIPLRTSNAPGYARGSYPLRWDEDYTNLVTVTNTADKVLNIGGAITADDMVYVLKREPIQPGSTIVWDVDRMKKEHIPDVNGRTLPDTAAYGKIHWIELGNGKNAGLLGRTSLSSVKNHRKSSFSCSNTCQNYYTGAPFFSDSPFVTLTVGGSTNIYVTQFDEPLYGPSYSYPAGTDGDLVTQLDGIIDHSFAQNVPVDGGTASILSETGLGLGVTIMEYDLFENYPFWDPDTTSCYDNWSYTQEFGFGQGGPTPAQVGKDSDDKTTYSGTTRTFCDGSGHVDNAYGYQHCIQYQIFDNNGNALQGTYTVHEDVTSVSSNIGTAIQTADGTSNANGIFLDMVGYTTVNSPPPSNACGIYKQTFSIGGKTVRVNCIRYSNTDATITDITANPTSCTGSC